VNDADMDRRIKACMFAMHGLTMDDCAVILGNVAAACSSKMPAEYRSNFMHKMSETIEFALQVNAGRKR
jgi:hypothetical protein